ncbi:MAG: FtsX-like permease family protein [Kiritimatiellaeota bacterium]|nr:FtsX-like permease family protein [Kiritimatiellota bacterium]
MNMVADNVRADLGEDAARLLEELSSGAAHLPLSTKTAIAAGSLRVRIARSSVTMTSIVLAIAFLVYMGTINAVNSQLAAQRDDAINILLYDAGVNIEATLAGNPRDRWLIVMALLTCTVGIANAMLMSVAERFREIGTMKCLGATDGLVVHLFLLESLFLGLVGTVIGQFVGLLVAGAVAGIQYGRYTVQFFPWAQEVRVLLWGTVAGTVLSVVGAVGPAWKAARMQPVEALRVEE